MFQSVKTTAVTANITDHAVDMTETWGHNVGHYAVDGETFVSYDESPYGAKTGGMTKAEALTEAHTIAHNR